MTTTIRRLSLMTALCIICALTASAAAEKRPLTFQDLMKFRAIDEVVIAENGAWIAYALWPDRGDGEVVVRSTTGDAEHRVTRGSEPQISADGSWVVALVKPTLEDVESAKDEKDGPKTGLAVMSTADGAVTTVERVEKFSLPENGEWLAYQHFKEEDKDNEAEDDTGAEDPPEEVAEPSEEAASGEEEAEEEKEKEETVGTTLVLRRLGSDTEIVIEHVTDFSFDQPGAHLAYAVAAPEGEGNGAFVRLLGEEDTPAVAAHELASGVFTGLAWPEEGAGRLAFVAAVESDGEPGDGELWTWDPAGREARRAAGGDTAPEGWFLPSVNDLGWSRDGDRLFFGFKPSDEKIAKEDDDEEAEDEPFDPYGEEAILEGRGVDVWHWNDPLINSNQKKEWKDEKDRSYRAVLHADTGRVVPLADREMRDVAPAHNPKSTIGLADAPYLREITWDDGYHDVYLVDLSDGSRQLVVSHLSSWPSLSPDGRFVVFYLDGHWHLFDGDGGTTRTLTSGLEVSFANEDHDYPAPAPGYGVADWVENDRAVLIYDKFDIWRFPTDGGEPTRITDSHGRENLITYRIVDLDEDRDFVAADERLLLASEHRKLKNRGYAEARVDGDTVRALAGGKFNRDFVVKAEKADLMLSTRQSYTEFPDLWISDLSFAEPRKLTDANPQIADFAWGSAELVEFTSADGLPLQGVLIKPGNYEEGKRYPVLVYYYRFFSQRLHNFNEPVVNHRPSFPTYASNGYAVFLPDIRFEVGRPGFAATKCLVPGVQKLVDMGIADPDAIGLHGHSWSGYQTAFVVTQTDIFAAAVAGAPVSNMTSAYGGIRWKSGLARQFQYEQSQSRLGASLWEGRDRYIDNSPLFFADRINTPLLLQHGDVDGAVPWYQSIELYLAMRRLGKECIFLQYRDEPHHLKIYANKLDYSIKMKQYFDHHLKGEPAPEWMTEGVPYRGK